MHVEKAKEEWSHLKQTKEGGKDREGGHGRGMRINAQHNEWGDEVADLRYVIREGRVLRDIYLYVTSFFLFFEHLSICSTSCRSKCHDIYKVSSSIE